MSRSKNSRKGSKYGKYDNEIWSKRAEGKLTGFTKNKWSKKLTYKLERKQQKPKPGDF